LDFPANAVWSITATVDAGSNARFDPEFPKRRSRKQLGWFVLTPLLSRFRTVAKRNGPKSRDVYKTGFFSRIVSSTLVSE